MVSLTMDQAIALYSLCSQWLGTMNLSNNEGSGDPRCMDVNEDFDHFRL